MDSSNFQPPASSPTQDVDPGLAVVLTMASLHGIAADEAALRHEFGFGRFDTQTILRAARSLGMTARAVQQNLERLDRAPLPAVARMKGEGGYFVVAQYQAGDATRAPRTLVQFPGDAPTVLTRERLLEIWTGELIYFTSKSSIAGTLARFDFSWFIPAIVTYRKLLGEVLAISLVLQFIALVTPLFFQVVMDKVLVNHAMKTLNVIAVGLICATLFEAALSGIRTWVFAHTSSKIDVELGARLFRHLLALPLAWFQARRVGDSVARIRELENIRAFLTGNAVTLVMDLAFSFVFLGVMLWYSAWLTLIVVVSIPLYVLLSVVFTPIVRRRLNEKFNKGAENQSFLVETISGIDTVKAMALEPRWTDRWDRQLAAYVSAGLSATNVATIASGGVTLISKLVTAAIMWLGATLVIDGKLTVGELVAFNMLAGQVSSPILRLAQLWNDFQQVGISMGRLGDILNTAPETAAKKTRVPRLHGAIEFDQVSFRYRPDASDVHPADLRQDHGG